MMHGMLKEALNRGCAHRQGGSVSAAQMPTNTDLEAPTVHTPQRAASFAPHLH